MAAVIRRFYLTLDARQAHVMVAGRGPVLLMLHTPPLWSSSLEPLIERLAAQFMIVAPDLAGYGLSDALPEKSPSVAAYASDLTRILDRLGVGDCAVYAAQEADAIAGELAARPGARVKSVVLDEPLMLRDVEKAQLLAHGLPDFAPDRSGSHLLRMWDAVCARFLFRPAHEPALANRLDLDMPSPASLNEVVKAYMRSGAAYGAAIRASVERPIRGTLASIPVPLLVLANERVTAERLPGPSSRVLIERLSSDPTARAAAITRFLRPLLNGDARSLRIPGADDAPPSGFSRLFIPVPGGHLHARVNLAGPGRPVLAMHDPAGSHELVLPFVKPMLGTRPVIALDMPGNGESDNMIGVEDISSATYARGVLEALDTLGLQEIDVIGRYSGGPVGMEMSFQRPALVKHLVQAAIDIYRPEDVADVLAHYTPSIAPRPDGSHLTLAWHNMKNQALFWPWFRQTRDGIVWGEPQLDPQLLHQRVFDLLRVGDMYQQAYAAMWNYPMTERLPLLRCPTLLCAPRWDPIHSGLQRASRVAPISCRCETLPDRFADWAAVFTAFFDDG